MADQVEIEVTGKSIYEVANQIAMNIIRHCEQSSLQEKGRQHYLEAVVDAYMALKGTRPSR